MLREKVTDNPAMIAAIDQVIELIRTHYKALQAGLAESTVVKIGCTMLDPECAKELVTHLRRFYSNKILYLVTFRYKYKISFFK